ncbi:hypothetical protein BgiMline_025681, partial [Biomphalaria glabrata]
MQGRWQYKELPIKSKIKISILRTTRGISIRPLNKVLSRFEVAKLTDKTPGFLPGDLTDLVALQPKFFR